MRIFCEIHESNYSTNNGCVLWNEHDIEYKASKNCLPASGHPLYKKAIQFCQINNTLKGKLK